MSEKKNIDKLFKEQFKDFEVMPNDAIWNHIEQELHKDKRKRRIIPIWWKLGGVAAALVLLLTVGNRIYNSENPQLENSIVDTKTKTGTKTSSEGQHAITNNAIDSSQIATPSQDPNNFSSENKAQEAIAQTEVKVKTSNKGVASSKNAFNSSRPSSEDIKNRGAIEAKTKQSNKNEGIVKASNSEIAKTGRGSNSKNDEAQYSKLQQENEANPIKTASQNNAVVQNQKGAGSKMDPNSEPKTSNSVDTSALNVDPKTTVASSHTSEAENAAISQADSIPAEAGNAIETAIALANANEDIEKEEEEPLNRWSVSPNVAPVYFNSLGKNGSTLDGQFVDNAKEGDVNVSYGISGSYAINKKLKIRAGMNKVDLGYRTNNVIVYDNTNTLGRSDQSISNVQLNTTEGNNTFLSAQNVRFASAPDILLSKEHAALDQNLGFIEVPIEIEYSVLNTKLGLNVIGGFSTLFLSDNEIFTVENNGNRTLMGEATNVNDLSYSANFGIGIDYKLSKKLKINLEPTFKYQLNTFSNTSGDFKPFFIGVYTGLSFKF